MIRRRLVKWLFPEIRRQLVYQERREAWRAVVRKMDKEDGALDVTRRSQ